jgi:V/A-type H+-transporting ATPase subunit C
LRLKSIEWPREILEKALLANGRIPANYFKNSLAATTAEFFRTFEYHRYDRLIRDGLGEYEDGASLARFEKLCDDMLIAYLRQAKYFAFGSEPLIAYALAREFETKNLRAIFVGKSNNFKEAEIRELLRESYV